MEKKKIIMLILISVALLIFIVIMFILLSQASNSQINTTDNHTIVSEPIPSSPETNFYKKYLNSNVQERAFPINFGNYIKSNYNYYDFLVNKTIPVEVTLLNSNGFNDSEDLYQKIYLANSPTGNFIQKYSYTDGHLSISMAIMEPAIGGKSYLLIGGIINRTKAYYFQVLIGDALAYNITSSDIPNIVKFDNPRNPRMVLDLLRNFVNEDIPDSYFKPFIKSDINPDFNSLPTGNFNLPETQER